MRVRTPAAGPASLVALALAASAPAAQAQPIAASGQDFVTAAASADTFEIMSGQLALIQSRSPAVRAFAREMIRDHTAAKAALAAAAARAGLAAPSNSLGGSEAAFLAALQGVGPKGFDRLYVRDQRLAHLLALETEGAFAKDGADASLRRAADADLPMIRRHLQQIGTL